MQVPKLNVPQFLERGLNAQLAVDRALARADKVRLVKHAHAELVAAKLKFTAAQRELAEFDESGRAA